MSMYELSDETKEHINNTLIRELGISYDEFQLLDFDEQQRLIEENRKKKNRNRKSDLVTVMIGSGDNAIFVKMKRGERYMLSDGTFVIAGDTPEDERKRLDERLDKIINKDESFVKNLTKKFKRK